MGLFDSHIAEIREYLEAKRALGLAHMHPYQEARWPRGGNRNVVLSGETAVELGRPELESVSFLVWTEDSTQVYDGRITVVGDDLQQYGRAGFASIPFGKIVIAGVKGFDGGNSFARYREMEGLRYSLDLRGYMMRAASQYMREWSRVSREALDRGFSFSVLGSALIDSFRSLEYVDAAEIVFVTTGGESVAELRPVAEKATKIINAMNKMFDEISFDCASCEYLDVCGEVSELREMRNHLLKGEARRV